MKTILFAALLAWAILSGAVFAETLTWDGNGDPNNDGDWSVPGNWNPAQVPGAGDIAILPPVTSYSEDINAKVNTRTITVDTVQTVGEVEVLASSGGLINLIEVAADLTVDKITGDFGWLHTEVAPAATLTLGNDLDSWLPKLTGSGAFVKVGTGTVSIDFGGLAETWTGTIDVQEGKFVAGWRSALGSTSMVTVQNGAMLDCVHDENDRLGQGLTLNGSGINGAGAIQFTKHNADVSGIISTSAAITLASDSTINIADATLEVTLSGAVSGPGKLTKIGPGKLMLGTGSLGGVEIAGGTLQVGGKLTSDIHIAAGATLIAGESQVIGTVTGLDEGGIWDKTVAASWVGPAGDPNDDGNWHDAANWSAGTLPTEATLPAPTANGSSETSTRTITVTAENPISVGKFTIPTGSWPYFNLVQVDSQFTVGQSEMPHDGAFHLGIAADATFTLGNDLNSQLPTLRGSGAFVKLGTGTVGTVVFGGSLGTNWTGTIDVQEGVFDSGAMSALGNTSMIIVRDGATFTCAHDWTDRMGSGLTLNGTGTSGQGAFRFTPGRDIYTRATLSLPTDSTIDVTNAAGILTIGGAVDGSGALTKTGLGTLVLEGQCNHGGTTIISEGGLGGTTSIANSLVMADGTRLAPGTSPGALIVGSAEVGAITYEWQINGVTGLPGIDWDLLDAGASLEILAAPAKPITVRVVSLTQSNDPGPVHDFESTQHYSWTFARADTITGFDPEAIELDMTDFQHDPGSGSFTVIMSGDELKLRFTPTIYGDVTGDCKVDILDMLAVRDHLGNPVVSGENDVYDVTGDGKIDILDMLVVRNNLNTVCGP